MDPETILAGYIDQPNTEEARNRIITRMVNAAEATASDDQGSLRGAFAAWPTVAGADISTSFANTINTGIISTPRHNNDISEYGRSLTFNYDYYNDPSNFLINSDSIRANIIPQKTITVNFITIVSNLNSDESPFMCQTGKVTIVENSERFFEDIESESIKSHIRSMILGVIKSHPSNNLYAISSSGSSNKRWICKKPLKAVDTIKEFLDEALFDITQRFFATQKKLQQFKLIKG